jgi:hypothetical protein
LRFTSLAQQAAASVARIGRVHRLTASLVATAGITLTVQVGAQQVRGRVFDDSTRSALPNASLEVLAPGGRVIARSTSDSLGGFTLALKSDGTFDVRVRRLGYAPRLFTRLDLTRERDTVLEVGLTPIVATLSPLVVSATRQLFTLVNPADLGRRLIDPQRIAELLPRARTVEDFVMLQAIPGFSIYDEPPNIRCVRLARGKPATNRTALGEVSSSFPRLSHSLADQLGCLMMFVDNVRVEDLLNIDPGAVELVVVLLPHEAGVLYGTGASRGVLLVYTKGAVR